MIWLLGTIATHRHAGRARARAAALGARDRARPDRDGGDRRHGRCSRRCGRCSCRSASPRLWWQHHWGLGPFDVAAWLVDAARRRSPRARCSRWRRSCCWSRSPCASGATGGSRAPPCSSRSRCCSSFVSGWLAAAGTEPLDDAAVRADIRQIARTEGVDPPVRVQKVSDWTDQANAFAIGLRPVDARRALGHAARRPLLARRDRRRRRARVRARQAPAHARRASPGTRCSRSRRCSSSPRSRGGAAACATRRTCRSPCSRSR